MTIVNVMRHYYSDANLKNTDGSYIDPIDAIGGVVKGKWNGETSTAPTDLLARNRPYNFRLGAIYLTMTSQGKINPALNNKHNLISVIVHENAHLKGTAKGDEDPQSHLNAYWEEISHKEWSNVDLKSDFAKGTIGTIGWLLYQSKDREVLQKKFEDKLGIKMDIKRTSADNEKGTGSIETTYEAK